MARPPPRQLVKSILQAQPGLRSSPAVFPARTDKQDVSGLAPTRGFDANLPFVNDHSQQPRPPLSKMPTATLVRSLLLHHIMASPFLRAPSMALLRLAATSKFWIFNPDKNPILAAVLYSTAYKQFCAGRNPSEVKTAISSMKKTGFAGVVLCYGREVVLDKNAAPAISLTQYSTADFEAVEQWKTGLIHTLECIEAGDILAIKFTGAGRLALDALKAGLPIPQVLSEALDTVCQQAALKGSRLWLDAEQTILQPTIDTWTIDLMRKYNTNGTALVSNTIQAYLKSAPENINKHLELASQEGWTLGIKLVRGAYIASDPRHLLHDTIEETHNCFDTIAANLINQEMPVSASQNASKFPNLHLFIATHNSSSVQKAQSLQSHRLQTGQKTINLEYGQLQGMADEISYDLVQRAEQMSEQHGWKKSSAPVAFKYLTWGTLLECLGYLYRRSVENRGAIERTRLAADALGREVWRRFTGA